MPEFSVVAFSLKPGQVADNPVHTDSGWEVIKLDERRIAPVATYEQAREDLRRTIATKAYEYRVASAVQQVKVERFNSDGSPLSQTDPVATEKADRACTDQISFDKMKQIQMLVGPLSKKNPQRAQKNSGWYVGLVTVSRT